MEYTRAYEQTTIAVDSFSCGDMNVSSPRQDSLTNTQLQMSNTMTMNFGQQTHQATEGHRRLIQNQSVGWVLAMAWLVTLAACDFNSNNIPDVAGDYSGEYWLMDTMRDGDQRERNGELSVKVEQSGSRITINGSSRTEDFEHSHEMTGNITESGRLEIADIGPIGGGYSHYSGGLCGSRRVEFSIEFTGGRMTWRELALYSNNDCLESISFTATLNRTS